MPRLHRTSQRTFTRRQFLALCGAAGAGGVLTACGGSGDSSSNQAQHGAGTGLEASYEHLFAGYTAAEEPDGDLAMVVWPEFVTASPPEVRELYEFHVTHGEVMRYIPCFCGCSASSGHYNNRDCYIREVHADGSVTFDSMAPT